MKAGGIVIIIVSALLLAGAAFFGIYSVKNDGAADRLEMSIGRRSRALGAMIGDRIRRKASRQGTYSIVLGIIGLLGLGGGIAMIKIGGKKKKKAAEQNSAGAQPVAAQPSAAPAAAAPVPQGQPLPPENWYVGVGGQQEGPITLVELQQRIASGALDGSAHVFHQQLGPWMPIGNVPSFAEALAARGS